MAFVEVEVECHLRVGGIVGGLEEIGGEGGRTYGVVATMAHTHVVEVCAAFLNHCQPFGVGIFRHVFLYCDNKQAVNLPGGFAHEILVAERERVGVHHYCPGAVMRAFACEETVAAFL